MTKSDFKYIQSLSQKKHRDAEGVFIAEGPKLVAELLSGSFTALVQVYATEAWVDSSQAQLKPGSPVTTVSEAELDRISLLTTPNQVLALFKKPNREGLRLSGTITLFLDTIQDPGNMGTIIRCADWFGITQVVCTEDSTDAYGPKAVQASMGSIGRVAVEYTDLIEKLKKESGLSVYAATLDGQTIGSVDRIKEGVIMIGNESRGLNRELIRLSTCQVSIPKTGGAESLNAAVATGIILSHLI